MYGAGRERKTKPAKAKGGGLRQRKQKGGTAPEDDCGWSSAIEVEQHFGASMHNRKRDKSRRSSKKHRGDQEDAAYSTEACEHGTGPFRAPHPWPKSREMGGQAMHKLGDKLFVGWADLLGSREELKRRLDAIAAVHGWEGLCTADEDEEAMSAGGGGEGRGGATALGGIEPTPLLQFIRQEIEQLEPAVRELETADLLLELRTSRQQLVAMEQERDRLVDDVMQAQEECFSAKDQLAMQCAQLEKLRELAHIPSGSDEGVGGGEQARAGAGARRRRRGGGGAPVADGSAEQSPSVSFDGVLSRGDVDEGRAVVGALARLKLPDETAMSPTELACWRENKKTITNSLKTLSGQIYSATTRILYEIIQNADDCSFPEDGILRELRLECSDDALVSFHNETGFQPKDLYALCQVGASSKLPGSNKIGRKGIGFKSVFQICDRPVILSPPFQFCFDTAKHGVFGYIVPSWVDHPDKHVPTRHRALLRRLFPNSGGGPAAAANDDGHAADHGGGFAASTAPPGTLLVCPMAPRVRGLDLMRDLNFDGLCLAFLKNLDQVTFMRRSGGSSNEVEAASVTREYIYRIERSVIFERGRDYDEEVGLDCVLQSISVMSHKLSQCIIVEQEISSSLGGVVENQRHFRLHSYTIHKHKVSSGASGAQMPATTTITLAFPVDDAQAPMRSADGESVFAYLPVTSAGFGFAINADFELVASRQDVSDSHSGNHVLLGRVAPLFVHALLSDPALGEDAFPMYLPDVESIRQDRSGGSRKWHTLASALHRETAGWMMIPTEDTPERVKRRHVVLRPRHLSQQLVPNSLLKEVSRGLSPADELNFAHPDAVVSMALEHSVDPCPVGVILACIRRILDGGDENAVSVQASGAVETAETKRRGKKPRNAGRKQKANLENSGDSRSQGDAPISPAISDAILLGVWQYAVGEIKACLQQGEAGQEPLRLLVDALIGGVSPSRCSGLRPFRIFPVRGSVRLRLHSEHGVSLSLGLSPALTASGSFILRLAERLVPRIDLVRLQGVEGIADVLPVLRIGNATTFELEQQLRNCFRFGLVTTADAQLWWDSFRYTVSKGFSRGLIDFMPDTAIALPLVDGDRIVSSRDVHRLSVSLPCILGLIRKPPNGNKRMLAVPPSVSTWAGRVRWELAIVQAFGITYPMSDVTHIPEGAFATDLLYAVAQARVARQTDVLEALCDLLVDVYKSSMGSFLAKLRLVMESSRRPEECLLQMRAQFHPFPSSCSPKFVQELLEFANFAVVDTSNHAVRGLIESSLGLLQLVPASTGESAGEGVSDDSDSDFESVNSKDEAEGVVSDDSNVEERNDEEHIDVPKQFNDKACDEVTWAVLEHLLGFRHSFDSSQCPWVLYSALTPALVVEQDVPACWDDQPKTKSIALDMTPLLEKLSIAAIVGSGDNGADVAKTLWPLICRARGLWLGSNLVPLESCVWKPGHGEVWDRVIALGCMAGPVVAIAPELRLMEERAKTLSTGVDCHSVQDMFGAIGSCCLKGSHSQHGVNWSPEDTSPALPYPTSLDMLLESTLPMLLERDGVCQESPFGESAAAEMHFSNRLSEETISCYAAIVNDAQSQSADGHDGSSTTPLAGFARGRRWKIPVPSATWGIRYLVVERGLQMRDKQTMLVFPDEDRWPSATAFVLCHFRERCLHPSLASIFAPIADRQSVGLESPASWITQSFKTSLRLAIADTTTPIIANAEQTTASGVASAGQSGQSLANVWALLSEVLERPLVAASTTVWANAADDDRSRLCHGDSWDLLLWAAITCAHQWHRMQTTGTAQDASCYQETLQRVRWLIPFVEATSNGAECSWGFLAERSIGTAGGSAILLLRSLFGFDLWGNLIGVELLEREPSTTVDIPTEILLACSDHTSGSMKSAERSFPEHFRRESLVLIWEWFLLEVASAAPPAVLWSTIQEPIVAWARPQIRSAEESLRLQHSRGSAGSDRPSTELSLEARMLARLLEHTQVMDVMIQMDIADEERRLAAEREAENRRRELQAAQERRRLAAETLRRQRERELQELEQQRYAEQERRRLDRLTTERERRSRQEALRQHRQQGQQRQQRESRLSSSATPSPQVVAPQQWLEPEPEHELDLEARHRQQWLAEHMSRNTAYEMQAPDLPGVASQLMGAFGRMFAMPAAGAEAAGATDRPPPVRRHVQGPTMRESEVRGKLCRFLAGMRAYERQQGLGQQPMPPVLCDFILWAGALVAGEQAAGFSRSRADSSGGDGDLCRAEEAARRYLGSGTDSVELTEEDEEGDTCCICLEELGDSSLFPTHGEPVETECGHRFHAVCFAQHLEASQQDPWCPICRNENLVARFR